MSDNTIAPAAPISLSSVDLWQKCLDFLQGEFPEDEFHMWIRPLHAQESTQERLVLLAPNRHVLQWVNTHALAKIQQVLASQGIEPIPQVSVEVGSTSSSISPVDTIVSSKPTAPSAAKTTTISFGPTGAINSSNANTDFTFENFVEGKSNQLALAATQQVAENPGEAYNPLFLYGGVGLGKTHLMHSIGNAILEKDPSAKVLYLHSERFVADMIKALQRNAMNEFKRFYRGINCLLIDDIQFFANKERSQEEFFHTFNSLLDSKQQIVLTCDRYPREIKGLEERLQSRFGWGLTVAVEPPELETRVAILMSKAEQTDIYLPNEVAFFIAKHIQSNVRELEGALKRVIANAKFTGQPITVEFAKEALKDLLTLQAKLVTIDNIQRTVAEYFKVRMSDLLSKRRSRSIARPRQIAMALAKELTTRSLPEIGEAFGGRDHTTVLHACRKIKELVSEDINVQEDWKNLLRILSA